MNQQKQAIPSRDVHSSQSSISPKLLPTLSRRNASQWNRPISAHTSTAFERVLPLVKQNQECLMLDSGCGTGESTRVLAELNREMFVIGVDKSAVRLARASSSRFANGCLIRAELSDFWRLCALAEIRFQMHYLLFPNPWPKPGHLFRRWHAHPTFPNILHLSNELIVRSNWEIYLQEFQLSLRAHGVKNSVIRRYYPERPISSFERKYSCSGQALYELRAALR